jgi:hypothetical protein
MKKRVPVKYPLIVMAIVIIGIFGVYKSSFTDAKLINSSEDKERHNAFDDPVKREEYEFNMLKDPITGKIPEGVFELGMAQARAIQEKTRTMRVNANTYSYQGPNNMGGQPVQLRRAI